MKFLDTVVAELSTSQAKRAGAIAGLAGGVDYLLHGGNVHALGVAGVVYAGIRISEPYVRRTLRRYGARGEDV